MSYVSGETLNRTSEFFKAHPVIGGVVFLILGMAMLREGIKTGTERAKFLDGPRVHARVLSLKGKESLPAHFEMLAKWHDKEGSAFSNTVHLYRDDFERLEKGSKVELALNKDNHAEAMLAKTLDNRDPVVTVAGVSIVPIGFIGLAIALFGIGFAIVYGPIEHPALTGKNHPALTGKNRKKKGG